MRRKSWGREGDAGGELKGEEVRKLLSLTGRGEGGASISGGRRRARGEGGGGGRGLRGKKGGSPLLPPGGFIVALVCPTPRSSSHLRRLWGYRIRRVSEGGTCPCRPKRREGRSGGKQVVKGLQRSGLGEGIHRRQHLWGEQPGVWHSSRGDNHLHRKHGSTQPLAHLALQAMDASGATQGVNPI